MDGADAFKAHRADCVIGFGGGAALDVAKVVGIAATHEGDIIEYAWDHPQVRPIGEAAAVLRRDAHDRGHRLRSGPLRRDQRGRHAPEARSSSAQDPGEDRVRRSGTDAGLPPAVTAATGMDALTHNIESYLSPAYHPLCDGIALEGTRIAARALRHRGATTVQPAGAQRHDDGSMMGAIAFQKDLGAVHSCAHALGAVCDLHHGLANALMIDTVLAWNQEAVPEKFDELAHVVQGAGGGEGFVPWLRALKRASASPASSAAHGVKREQIPRLVEIAVADICHQTNPRPCTARGFPTAVRGGAVLEGSDEPRLKIGISACFMHADPARPMFTGKTLQYLEQSIAHWVMSTGALAVMIPARRRHAAWRRHAGHYANGWTGWCCTAAPTSRRSATASSRCRSAGPATRSATNTRWSWWPHSSGTASRYSASAAGCNCSTSRTAERLPGYPDPAARALRHRDAVVYDGNFHTVDSPGSRLARPVSRARRGPRSTASITRRSRTWRPASAWRRQHEDGLIEAIRRPTRQPYVAAVQWHPEFHQPGAGTIDDAALLADFLGCGRGPPDRHEHLEIVNPATGEPSPISPPTMGQGRREGGAGPGAPRPTGPRRPLAARLAWPRALPGPPS